jgi:hypothetical protein
VTPDQGWHSLRGTRVHLLDEAHGWRTEEAIQRTRSLTILHVISGGNVD